MYRHSKYNNFNAEAEKDKLKEEIRELQKSNKDKINLLIKIEELLIQNQHLKQSAVNHTQKIM